MAAIETARGAIFTVPAGRDFLACLASAILSGDLPRRGGAKPAILDLPAYTLLMPTRRAARALQTAFLDVSGGKAMLLPRIRPIAEGQEDLTLLSGLADPASGTGDDGLAPAVSEIERRLVLTGLVLRWSQAMRVPAGEAGRLAPYAAAGAQSPMQAAGLAAELGRLIDMVETENVDLGRLATLVPEMYSEHWQQTMQFLEIVLAAWPAYLEERGLLSPAARRNGVILAEAARLAAKPPAGPVIVAGVTGSIPATAELMRVVARLGNGAIVLPGLDQDLDDTGWQAIVGSRDQPGHPEHPQFGLAKLLAALGVARRDVEVLAGAEQAANASLRARLVSEAMRPASTTAQWPAFIAATKPQKVRDALAGVACLDAPTAQDEAEAIVLILRESLETPGRTAALVTPDRLLARRVAVRLEALGIRVDDSAGRPLAKTAPGAFLDLAIEAQRTAFAPAEVMALLKHPLTRLGFSAFDARRGARALELAVFRDVYLGRGLAGISDALARARLAKDEGRRGSRAARRLWKDDWRIADELLGRLVSAFAPLDALFSSREPHQLRELAAAHVAVVEALARLPEPEAVSPLWSGEAGAAASLFFTGVMDPALPAPAIKAADYADLYRGLVGDIAVRPLVPVHPRISIWGPFEARLQQPDVLVLGSLNEATWPEAADPGPWLNRPMRGALGMPQPEEDIGRAAHDFTQLLGAATVYLTRAQKVDGVPAVASRWLLRLRALLQGLAVADALAPDRPWLGWARARDLIGERRPIKAPAPRPPVAMRPRSASVSEIETWMANPYAIFAARILELEPLTALGQEPDAALRGAIVHEALGRFAAKHPGRLPGDVRSELIALAEAVLADYAGSPRVAAFWGPRFARFAEWFGETEAGRRKGMQLVLAEIAGQLVLAGPAGPFTLRARADRIDASAAGLVISDYKTGSDLATLARRAVSGEAPQLSLEAAIAAAGGFPGIETRRVATLRYISTSGGEPAGDALDLKTEDVSALAEVARRGLERLIAQFDDPATPYMALRRARFDYAYDGFAHLARVAEWGAASSGVDGGDG